MALAGAFLCEDQFTCSICLEVFENPVSTPCGHSFCQSCISSYWDGGRGAGRVYLCPICKESFRKRPELHINRTLKEITEQFKHIASAGSGLPSSPDSGPEARYTLSGPSSSSPPPPLCPVHQRGLEFFCHTDGVCVCSACVDRAEHRGHSVSPAKREWQIKKSQLGISEMELKGLLSEREKKAEEIQESLKAIQAAAESQTDGAMCAFSKLISSVESCQTDVLEVIELSRRAAEHRAQSLLKELEEELTELRKRSAALSQLSRSEDYVHFLKTFPGLSAHPQTKDWSGVGLASELTSGAALRTVSHVMEQIQEEMQRLPESCQRILLDQSAPRTNPKIKRVQEYAADITLDPYTAHPRLIISPDGKQVHCGERHQQIPDNPERFDRVVCVLAHQGFSSGRHYWEVDVGGKTDWDLGVASRSVNRKGKITVSPAHGYWFLSLRDQSEYAFRTEPSTSLALSIRPSRIGIYVDFEKGVVSFYNVEARLLIFTFADAFPDTIYPFFSPCTNKSGRNEAPLIIRPVA
uniref:Bloodthirsty-related gene family, member 1 n=1 Tax=Tetraodon nigroviridis TaxID=99883 RepID=H3D9D1_TETNG